jgi:hypothetical protein
MPENGDKTKAPAGVSWQDQLAQANEAPSAADTAWKKVRKSERKDAQSALERQRAARLARDAK